MSVVWLQGHQDHVVGIAQQCFPHSRVIEDSGEPVLGSLFGDDPTIIIPPSLSVVKVVRPFLDAHDSWCDIVVCCPRKPFKGFSGSHWDCKTRGGVQAVLEACGVDYGHDDVDRIIGADNPTEALSLFIISPDDVGGQDVRIYHLSDPLFAGDVQGFERVWSTLCQDVPVAALSTYVTRQVIALIGSTYGSNPEETCVDLGISPRATYFFLQKTPHLSPQQCYDCLKTCETMDIISKTTMVNSDSITLTLAKQLCITMREEHHAQEKKPLQGH